MRNNLLITSVFGKSILFLILQCILFSHTVQSQKKKTRDSLLRVLYELREKQDFNSQSENYVTTLLHLGKQLRYHNSDSLLLLGQQAAQASEAMNFGKGKAWAYMNLGDYYSDMAAHDKSQGYYNKALKEAIALKDDNLILEAKYCLTLEYSYQGDLASSFKEYLGALELAESTENLYMQSVLNGYLANIYVMHKNYEDALPHYEISERASHMLGDEVASAYNDVNFAFLLGEMGDFEKAFSYLDKSISVFENEQMIDWLAFAYSNKGFVYLKQKNYKEALAWFAKSKLLYEEKVEDKRSEIGLLQGFSEVHLGLKNYEVAENYAQETYKLAEGLKDYERIRNAAQILHTIYKTKNDFKKSLEFHEIFKKLSDSLANNESKKNLIILKVKLEHDKEKQDLIARNEAAIANQKSYVYLTLFILVIVLIITIIIKSNERAQGLLNKELNLKNEVLEKQENELREINGTKDKLFSIIAHDLRAPINSFKSLMKYYGNGDISEKELMTFIPRMGLNIEHISFTLDNLLSWGQNQLKGNLSKPSTVNMCNVVQENVNLLSETAIKKSILIKSQLEENTLVWGHADEIDIVVRNLLSNALKFTPKNGSITLKSEEKDDNWIISIKDTGVGIDKENRHKVFSNNSNLTTYGTANEKGTGLGLILCKEMVENNNGAIWFESSGENGSCFYFTIPKTNKRLVQAS